MDLLQVAGVVLGSNVLQSIAVYLATRPKNRADAANQLVNTALQIANEARKEAGEATKQAMEFKASNSLINEKYSGLRAEFETVKKDNDRLTRLSDDCIRDRAKLHVELGEVKAQFAKAVLALKAKTDIGGG